MNNKICEFSFNLTAWNIVCNKVLTEEDWKLDEDHWQQNSEDWEDFSPKLAFLSPLKRRRLSDSARLFFEAAWELTAQDENLPVVYASSNSEINRSFALWQTLLQEGDVSPTSFSLSVHNALVGQWSEMRQVKTETTAITARKDNLETALLEANLLLNDSYDKVLVVVCESPLYAEYNAQPVQRQPFAYALAMIVEKGEQYHLSLHSQAVRKEEFFANNMDNALHWVKQQHLAQSQWQTPSSREGYWQWQKN
ncbi:MULTISPECIES: beta-ketoacyl synthase chain length factor [Glaesserella]|uniref:Beta-ketoacyl synthase-like N-terminal domain-containing protein n=1 Tax=Glaesserella australis TaxID=2094024 RepID=A0A328BWK2_9PAST|nr:MULTISPECIES: beta-ketoacyl synthase chain length factor [Glaesserella]AUI66525.1 hypothetical protein CJD39_08020 [Glaesserella sp. 15-184]RAL18698.1 hypothetical protein C5N92_06040 [Glaesserella australis]